MESGDESLPRPKLSLGDCEEGIIDYENVPDSGLFWDTLQEVGIKNQYLAAQFTLTKKTS